MRFMEIDANSEAAIGEAALKKAKDVQVFGKTCAVAFCRHSPWLQFVPTYDFLKKDGGLAAQVCIQALYMIKPYKWLRRD